MFIEPSNEQVLVSRAQEGDAHAFNLLVKEHRCSILRLVSHLTRNSVDSDDLVQETFIRAYRAIRLFRGDARFYTWLYKIALNVIKSHQLRQRTLISLIENDYENDGFNNDFGAPFDIETPESNLACKQMAAAVSITIENLPEDSRTAFALRQFDGLSYQEIADRMECPIGTVRSRISRARETISDRLLSLGH